MEKRPRWCKDLFCGMSHFPIEVGPTLQFGNTGSHIDHFLLVSGPSFLAQHVPVGPLGFLLTAHLFAGP